MRRHHHRLLHHLRLAAALTPTLLGAACMSPTGSDASDIAMRRAKWVAHGLTAYEYDYRITGFQVNFTGHTIHLVVRAGAVESATDVTLDAPAVMPPAQWPTIDDLFDEIEGSHQFGTLRAASFDPTLDYPTQFEVLGLPDASGSVFASNVRALP